MVATGFATIQCVQYTLYTVYSSKDFVSNYRVFLLVPPKKFSVFEFGKMLPKKRDCSNPISKM